VKIEIYPQAETDIIRQFRYYLVDQDAPLTAFRFRESVLESIDQLKPHPRMGTLFPGSISGLRSWPVKGFEAFRIYYHRRFAGGQGPPWQTRYQANVAKFGTEPRLVLAGMTEQGNQVPKYQSMRMVPAHAWPMIAVAGPPKCSA
jgi:plasmid stabilization system protein ParE